MKTLDAITDVAATARITRLVVEDEISRPFREWVESATGEDSKLTYLVNCPYCVSVWAGAAVQVLPRWAVRALALSGGTLAAKWLAETTEGAVGGY